MTQCFLSYDQKGILWMMSKMMSKIKCITKRLPSKTLGSLEISMVPKAGLEPARRELRLILSLFSHVSSKSQYTETLKVLGFQASCIGLYFSVCNYSRMSKRCQITATIFPSLSPALVQCKKISPEAEAPGH